MKNKEITFYELMGLINDGKEPKELKICGGNNIYKFNKNYSCIEALYLTDNGNKWFDFLNIKADTKFEILPEENDEDEWEDIEEHNIKSVELDLANVATEPYYIMKLMERQNQLIRNQKYLKEKLESKNE